MVALKRLANVVDHVAEVIVDGAAVVVGGDVRVRRGCAPAHDPPRAVPRFGDVRQRGADDEERRAEFHVELLVDGLAVHATGSVVGVTGDVPGVDLGVQQVDDGIESEESADALLNQRREGVRVGEVSVLDRDVA